jgi:LPS-assembly protein
MGAMQIRFDSGGPRGLQVRAWLLCGVLGFAMPVFGATATATAVEPAGRDTADDSGGRLAGRYWVERADLAPEQLEGRPEYCSGRYVLPPFPYPLDSDPDTFPIRGDAENVTYFLDGRVALNGAVTLSQGNRRITGHQGSLDQETGQGLMSGQVQVLEPGLVFEGESARVDLESRGASVDGVQFLLPQIEIRGQAASIAQDADGNLIVTDGRFTRCEPGNRNWHIAVGSLEMNQDEVFATARHATVKVGNVPVLYTPYLRFPVRDDRQSGLLFPDMGYSEQDGLDLRVPYYLNLAPDYDATLAPRFISDRGTGLEGEFRHLTSWGRTTLTGTYLNEDDMFDGTLTRDDFNRLRESGVVTGEFEPADRWLYGIDHAGEIGDFTTLVDYRAVSDRDYFRDLGGDIGVSSRFELERRGELGYARDGLQLRFWAQRFDRLDDGTIDPYQRLPQFDARYDGELFGPLEWSMAAQVASFDRANGNLTGLERAIGERVHVEPRIRLPFYRPWGYLSFAGGVRHTRYDLRQIDDPALDSSPDRNVGHGSVEGGLYLDRTIEAFGRSVNHSLEPQVFYLYQGYENQDRLPQFDASDLTFSYSQLFRDNRFAGVDRIGDANQLSLGFTTRFVDSANGREYLRASVGQILYFEDRRVTLTGQKDKADEQRSSAMAGEVSGSLTEQWRVTSTIIWDPNLGEIDEGAIALQHQRDDRRILNLGYRYRLSDDISQPDVSAYWPVSRHFGFIGRWNYDIEQGRVIESFGGLEYNDCCFRIRLVARRFLNIPTGPNIVSGAGCRSGAPRRRDLPADRLQGHGRCRQQSGVHARARSPWLQDGGLQ